MTYRSKRTDVWRCWPAGCRNLDAPREDAGVVSPPIVVLGWLDEVREKLSHQR